MEPYWSESKEDFDTYQVALGSKYRPVNCTSQHMTSGKQTDIDVCTWKHVLHYAPYPTGWPSDCTFVTTEQFWTYMAFVLEKLLTEEVDELQDGEHNVVLLATHHHRLKKLILPLLPNNPQGVNGYATSCVLWLNKNNYQVIFTGFPDKVGKKGYKYACNSTKLKQVWPASLVKILDKLFDQDFMERTYLMVCRHGNAQHNKPLKRGTGPIARPLDSPLTPLGFQTNQAAAQAVYWWLPDRTRLFMVASSLGRTQHTALHFLKEFSQDCVDVVPKPLRVQTSLMDALSINRLKRYLDNSWKPALRGYAISSRAEAGAEYQRLVEEFFDAKQLQWLQQFIKENVEECGTALGRLGQSLRKAKIDYDKLARMTYFRNENPSSELRFTWKPDKLGTIPDPSPGFHERVV